MRGSFTADRQSECIQLYAYIRNEGVKFYNRASDVTAFELGFHDIKTEHTKKSVIEHVAVDLPRKFLEDRRGNDISIKIYGKAGRSVVNIPNAYIKGFMDKFDAKPIT